MLEKNCPLNFAELADPVCLYVDQYFLPKKKLCG